MPDPADTAAGETKSVGNWNNAPGGTTSSNNGTTSSAGGGTTTSNNGGTQTSAPGKTDSEAKTSSTSNNSAPSSSKSTSTSQNISSPATTQSAPATTASPATTNTAPAAAGTSYTPSTTSSVKVADPSRGTMAGNPATGATYTAGSPTPTYDANDGIVSTAEAEARYNATQALNSAFGVGPGTPSAPSAPAAPDGAFGPRANPAADYMSSIMGGTLGPVGPTSGLMGTPPGKAITDRVAPDLTRIATSFVTQPGLPSLPPSVPSATRGITAPAAPAAPVTPGFLSLPPDVPRATPPMPAPAAPPMTPRNAPNPPGTGQTVYQNNLGATGPIANLAQVVADPSISAPPQQAPTQYAGYGAPFSPDAQLQNYAGLVQSGALNPVTGQTQQPQPASGYPPSEYAGYGAPFNSEVQIGQWENVDPPADGTAPSQVAGQPQTAGELANRAQYTYDQARDGFKGMLGRIYDAIVGGNITAGQDLAALQDQRGGGGGILPQDEPVDVASLEQLMAQLKRRGVSGNQQLKLILSTFV